MSFWNDLEEMQEEIENLDARSVKLSSSSSSSPNHTSSTSTRSTKLDDLEAKADKLTKQIKLTKQKNSAAPKENKNLMNHLGVLEKELKQLNRKENDWSGKAKDIQSEVNSLKEQIKKLKSKSKQMRHNKRKMNDSSKIKSGRSNNTRFFRHTPKLKTPHSRVYHQDAPSRSMYCMRNKMMRSPQCSPKHHHHHHRAKNATQTMDECKETQINIYQFQRLQRINQQLVRDNQNLKSDIAKYTNKHLTESQHLKSTLAEKDVEISHLKQQLENVEYSLRDDQNLITDLQSQIVVLQQAVEEFDNLRDSDSKLQLEYQRSLQNVLEARKDKTIIEQQLNAAKNQIQEMEINHRQLNHEKLGALSEMRAMKNVFEQERKNVSDRYERIVQKLESELAYAKKMYQEIKGKYSNLQYRFENDQPQYEVLKQKIDIERDQFQSKLNDVVINHCSTLDMISKESHHAIQNSKWMDPVANLNDTRMEFKAYPTDKRMKLQTTREIISDDDKSGARKMNGIWEPDS